MQSTQKPALAPWQFKRAPLAHGSQEVQFVDWLSVWKLFVSQFLQLGWATSSWYFPGSQAAHTSAPADADLPTAQLLQLVEEASSWNLPLGHTRQKAWPMESWKRPATQG